MNNKVYCNDGCQQEFTVSNLTTGMDKLPGNIERHYIECPNCYQQYTSYYLNDDMKKIQSEIKQLRINLPNLKIKQKNRLHKLTNKLLHMSEQLTLEMEQGERSAGKLH